MTTIKRSRLAVYFAGFITTIIADAIAIISIYLMTLPRAKVYLDQFLIISGGMNRWANQNQNPENDYLISDGILSAVQWCSWLSYSQSVQLFYMYGSLAKIISWVDNMIHNHKPKRKNDDLPDRNLHADLWTYLIILMIVLVSVIFILSLLGPAVGNVFSNIAPCTLGGWRRLHERRKAQAQKG